MQVPDLQHACFSELFLESFGKIIVTRRLHVDAWDSPEAEKDAVQSTA